MSRLNGFYGSRTKLEHGRTALADRLRTVAQLIENMSAEKLAEVYYDCDFSLDEVSRLLGLPLPNRQYMWSEFRDSRRALDQL